MIESCKNIGKNILSEDLFWLCYFTDLFTCSSLLHCECHRNLFSFFAILHLLFLSIFLDFPYPFVWLSFRFLFHIFLPFVTGKSRQDKHRGLSRISYYLTWNEFYRRRFWKFDIFFLILLNDFDLFFTEKCAAIIDDLELNFFFKKIKQCKSYHKLFRTISVCHCASCRIKFYLMQTKKNVRRTKCQLLQSHIN